MFAPCHSGVSRQRVPATPQLALSKANNLLHGDPGDTQAVPSAAIASPGRASAQRRVEIPIIIPMFKGNSGVHLLLVLLVHVCHLGSTFKWVQAQQSRRSTGLRLQWHHMPSAHNFPREAPPHHVRPDGCSPAANNYCPWHVICSILFDEKSQLNLRNIAHLPLIFLVAWASEA